jgi:hypothetical protein
MQMVQERGDRSDSSLRARHSLDSAVGVTRGGRALTDGSSYSVRLGCVVKPTEIARADSPNPRTPPSPPVW